MPMVDETVSEGDHVRVGNLEARVLNRLALQVEGYAKQGHAQTGYRAIELASALEDLLTALVQQSKAS